MFQPAVAVLRGANDLRVRDVSSNGTGLQVPPWMVDSLEIMGSTTYHGSFSMDLNQPNMATYVS